MKRRRTRQASVKRWNWQTVFGKRWLAVVLSAVLIAGNVPAYALDALAFQEASAEGVAAVVDEAAAQDDAEAGASVMEQEAAFEESSAVPQETVSEDPSAAAREAEAQEADQEAAAQDASAQDAPAKEAAAQDSSAQDAPAKEAAAQDASAPAAKTGSSETTRTDPAEAAETSGASETSGAEQDPIEEPAEEGGLSDLNEAAGFRVDELEDLSAYLAFGEEKELAAGGHGMFFFKFVPEENGFYALRTSDLMNAGVYGYIYDGNANLAAEMHPRTGENLNYTCFLREGSTYYFEIILNRVGSAAGDVSARFYIENGTSGYYFARVGEHDRIAVVNTEITLEVEAYSTSAITYRWFFNNSVIQGATSASITFVVKRSGRYHCQIRDADGHISDLDYVVHADNELGIRAEGEEEYSEQTDVHLEPGDGTQLKVVVSAIDMSGITYEWSSYVKKNTAWGENWEKEPISGETGDTLVLETPKAGSIYVCTVSDQYGNSAEKLFNIFIDNNLSAYTEGTEQTSLNINTAAKQLLRLGVTASADEDSGLTYAWYRGDTVIEGAQTDSYETMLPQSAAYKCVVSDPYGNSAAVNFNVRVDNELAAYAGGMQSSEEDIYVIAGENALMTVDVTAIDKSDLTYVWEKELRTSIPWGDRYEWRQISGAETGEYTAEAVSEDTNYRCTVSDRYGNSAQVRFSVHVAEEEQFIEVRLTDPSGEAVVEGYTVKWYAEDGTPAGSGAKLHGVTAQETYTCDVRLGEDLSFRYEQPEPAVFTAGENSESHDLQLSAIEAVTITGTVSSKAGEKIPGASVKLKQVYNGQYTKILETEADDSGCFALSGFKTESTLIVSAADYFDGYYAVAPGPEETEISVSAVLEEIPANRITLSLFMRKAAVAGEEGEKQELAAANGLSFSVRNMTRMSDLSDYKVQFPYIVLGSEEAGAGDVIRIFAEDAKGVMAPGEIEVTLDEAGCAEAEWILVQNGSIRVRKISGNDENTVIVFGEDGKSVQSGTAAASFDSGPLPEGSYSCVLIKKTGSLRSIDTLDRLAEFGLSEGRDYIKLGAVVEKGIVTVIDGAVVPALDEAEFVYTVADGTQFWANRTEAVAGQYVRMSLAYEIDDRYESADETVTFELPEGMTFIERSLTVDGKAFSCTVTEHSGMQTAAVPVGRRTGTIRFNVMLTATGSRSIYARLSFQNGTSALSQPLGSVLLSISGASISVPEKTGQKTVTVTGQTLPDCKVTVYDNGTEAGTTTTNKNGAWALKFDLVDPYHYSRHMITGKIESAEFGEFETEAADLYYNSNFAQVSRVVMRNQSFVVVRSGGRTLLSQPDPVVFDFLNPSTAIPSFTYSPGAPMFTFVVEFTKNNYDPDAIRDVYVITTDSSGARTKISCSLDERTGKWIGTHSYGYSDVPCKLSVSCVNNTGATYDTDYSEDEMSAILEEERNICAEIGEQVADKVQIGNEQEQPGKVSFDAILGGKSIGNCAIEEMDFSEIDLDRWLADHRVLTDTADGKTCYTAYEFTDSGFDIYVVIPEDRMMGRMTFTPAEEFRSEMENAANEALSGLIEEANAALAEADAAEAGELSGDAAAAGELSGDAAAAGELSGDAAADGTSNAAAGTSIAKEPGGFIAIANFFDGWGGILVPGFISAPLIIGRDYDALYERFGSIKRNACSCPSVSAHNNRLYGQAGLDMTDYLQIALVKFGFSVVIDTVLKPFIVGMDVGYWSLNKLLHYFSRNGIGVVTNDLMNFKGTFRDALGKINAMESELRMCTDCGFEKFCDCRDGGGDEERQCFIMTPRIDPSGYVYEAVPSNRVSGVKAEVYSYDYAQDEYGFPEENKSEILWDAENYDQVNPQYTDGAGTFGWDVPEGQWLVRFSKEGYEDTDSRLDAAADEEGYLPVPPIQTEVNTAIVSKAAPGVSSAAAYPGEVRIVFSQYMQIGSVNTGSVTITAGGKQVAGTVRPLDAEYNYEKTEQFASSFAFVPDKELSGTVTVAVSGAKNYCGRTMAESYRKAHAVEVMPKELLITGSRNIEHYGSTELTVKIQPAEAGRNKTLTVTTYAPDIVSPETVQSVTADQNGVAKVVLNGNLPGQGILSISLDGTEILENILITVGQTSDTVSLEDGGYSISLDKETLVYSGKAQTPKVTIDGLTEGTDFTVGYENNVDPGTATVTVTGIGGYTGTLTGAFTILPGKTKRGDMFNLANNVKVTWYEVPGAKYYKVYREGVTDPRETRKEPVIVTTGLVGWDKDPGLTNGNAYRYRIVASLSGRGDSSGDSTLSYSKLMYRLKTVVIRSVKNTAPGKVTVKYDRTVSGDSYVLQYCEREDMVGAKTKVVLGAANTSYVIGGLKKGKTYYISIRVRKKVGGIDYYTTFGVAKKIKITK